ncbi:MAG: DUF2163 domain-containing protein [Hyphomicrobiales bacterium]|nr:DUF2163 domain-containing protein [Hyphomicrobiales bacterium]
MRNVPPDIAAQYAAGATTFCTCWTLIPRGGPALGFTDHDGDLIVNGTLHAAATGVDGADLELELGLATTAGALKGALTSGALDEVALAGGAFDGARIEVRLVDWTNSSQWLLLDAGLLGEVKRDESGFTAEIRGVAQALDQERGRYFQPSCSADLGDARCKVDLAAAAYNATGSVTGGDGGALVLCGPLAQADHWFSRGALTFSSGANAGLTFAIKDQRALSGGQAILLWDAPPAPVAAGDSFALVAGCDKSWATCGAKFANAPNFRGFPSMPGDDRAFLYPSAGDSGANGDVVTP